MLPTSTRISLRIGQSVPANADAVAVFIPEEIGTIANAAIFGKNEHRAVAQLIAAGATRGKARDVAVQVIETPRGHRHVIVAGLGKAAKLSAEAVRESAGAVMKAARQRKVRHLAILPPGAAGAALSSSQAAAAAVSGLLLAGFRYDEYKGAAREKGEDEDRKAQLTVTVVTSGGAGRDVAAAVERAKILADAQNYARTIASRPGNDINPPKLAQVAQELAREVGLGCRVLDEKQMARLGMGGILAVGAGSIATPPRMIALEYRPRAAGKRPPLLVVGKAITFDTGGISIKPASNMGEMIFDKCGGMAVLGLMYALAKLKVPVPVVGILASAENHISEKAYRPGDILRMYNGVTVEVTNTDAEGRLVLGDALAWGIKTYKPAAVLDLATLTGGVIVGLGHTLAGVMSNSDALMAELQAAADAAGEKIWRLPLGEEQREQIKSRPADIVNSAGKDAQPLQGGAFLSYFVPEGGSIPWAHLDIAGVADTDKELPYYAKGATGWGVRTLVEWAEGR